MATRISSKNARPLCGAGFQPAAGFRPALLGFNVRSIFTSAVPSLKVLSQLFRGLGQINNAGRKPGGRLESLAPQSGRTS
jgi:hypothetical protein